MILGAILVITFASLIPILVWPEGFTPHSSRYAPSNRRKPRLILLILTIGVSVANGMRNYWTIFYSTILRMCARVHTCAQMWKEKVAQKSH